MPTRVSTRPIICAMCGVSSAHPSAHHSHQTDRHREYQQPTRVRNDCPDNDVVSFIRTPHRTTTCAMPAMAAHSHAPHMAAICAMVFLLASCVNVSAGRELAQANRLVNNVWSSKPPPPPAATAGVPPPPPATAAVPPPPPAAFGGVPPAPPPPPPVSVASPPPPTGGISTPPAGIPPSPYGDPANICPVSPCPTPIIAYAAWSTACYNHSASHCRVGQAAA